VEQFEPKLVHILPKTHKENRRHKVTLPPSEAEFNGKVEKHTYIRWNDGGK
jgi:hypothetical protein